MGNSVNHPDHYNAHPSGVECITIVEHMNFNLGNAMKYIWRADEKGNDAEDLHKAKWYIEREIQRRIELLKKETEQIYDGFREKGYEVTTLKPGDGHQ